MKIKNGEFILGDCLEKMQDIETGSVDMILADLPYGTTACKWDMVITFKSLWNEYWRIVKPNAAIVLTASQPFTSSLIMSAIGEFKYCLVWEKSMASGFAHAKNKPLKAHEDVCVFSMGTTVHANQSTNRMPYFPQMEAGNPYTKTKKKQNTQSSMASRPSHAEFLVQKSDGERYPRSVLKFANPNRNNIHPTQKPVALFEYLIKTYTNEGEVVLDNTAGSGTTAVAAENTGRRWICIEKDETYYNAAVARVKALA